MSSRTEAITIAAEIAAKKREGESEAAYRQASATPRGAPKSFAQRFIREPLIHFLLAGVLLFGADIWFSRGAIPVGDQSSIRVSRAEIERLSEVWTRQYGRAPDSAEIKNLVDEYVREEILYREAIASGLDKGDTIIRRRLVEKMEFLSQEVAGADPSDDELLEYFNRNREKFRIPAQVAFSHTYFSTSKRGPAAESEAERALRTLRRPSSPDASQLGDSFMLQNEYPAQTQEEIKGLFGDEFAGNLFQLHPGTWEGPIRSSYGLHLVKISRYLPSRIPELAEVRNQVLTDFKNQQLQNASEAYYARLRSRYRVDVDNAALAAAQSPPKKPPNHSGSRESATPDED